jgi:hypothetical protein
LLFFLIFFFPRRAGFLINYQLDEKETKNQDKTKLLCANPPHPPKADKLLAVLSGQRTLGNFGGMQIRSLCGVRFFNWLSLKLGSFAILSGIGNSIPPLMANIFILLFELPFQLAVKPCFC